MLILCENRNSAVFVAVLGFRRCTKQYLLLYDRERTKTTSKTAA